MLYLIIGTKGQFVKMFPLMKLLDEEHVPFLFVHTGQHFSIINRNIARLNIRPPDIFLSHKKKDLAHIGEFVLWALRVLEKAKAVLHILPDDYVITHGDTESTLLSLIIAKYFRAKVIHVESGLRSGDMLNPFPEEIIRRVVCNFADICFCPTTADAKNIRSGIEKYVTEGNTVFDSIKLALAQKPSLQAEQYMKQKYILFLVHRKENLFRGTRKKEILFILEKILQTGNAVAWVLHENTKHEFKKSHLWDIVMTYTKKYHLSLVDSFFDYVDFMHIIKNSRFVVSDGGGLQEETYVLNKPMLILRTKTERTWGIGETAYLSGLDGTKVNYFLENVHMFRRKKKIISYPSKMILNTLVTKFS